MPTLAAPPQLIVFEPMTMTIRPMVAADRGGVFRILENAGNFTPEEVGTALELTGYALVGRIPEYYKAGDDKLIFAKRFVESVSGDVATPADASAARELVPEL
jgi:hypothetical protein